MNNNKQYHSKYSLNYRASSLFMDPIRKKLGSSQKEDVVLMVGSGKKKKIDKSNADPKNGLKILQY